MPIGEVFDQIAVWQIAEYGYSERKKSRKNGNDDSLFAQMQKIGR